MLRITPEDILKRLRQGTGARSDTELARLLGVSQQAVSNARKNAKVPDGWMPLAAQRFGLSTDWLFFGVGGMKLSVRPESETGACGGEDEADGAVMPGNGETRPGMVLGTGCSGGGPAPDEWRRLLAAVAERGRLETEVLELGRENRALWRENGDLRAENAVLREQLNPARA